MNIKTRDFDTQKYREISTRVTNKIPAMLAYWDKSEICRFANTAYLEWFGKTQEEMVDTISMKELLGSLYEKNLPYIKRALNGENQHFEREITIPSGEVRYSLATYTPDIVNNEVLGFIAHVTDITNNKKVEISHSQLEKKFRNLLESTPEALVIVDESGCIQLINQQLENIFGYSKSEIIGQSVDILLPERFKDNHGGHMRTYFRSQKNRPMGGGVQLHARRKNGEEFPIEISLSPIESSDGLQIAAAIRDTTERIVSEAKLKEISDRLKLATHYSSIGIWEYDVVENVLAWDDIMFQLYGVKKEHFSGAYDAWKAGLHPEDRAQAERDLQMAISGEKEFDTEFRVVWPDQTVHFIKARAMVQRDASGSPLRMLGTNWDITNQKNAEAERKVFEIALTVAKTKAEEANKAKSQFLSVMSHEIRTPMNAVIGLTDFMIEENPTKHQLENLKLLKYSGENLLTVVNDILDFSKIEAGKMDLEEESFDLIELLQNITKIMQLRAKEKNLNLFLKYNTELPQYIKGDSVRINQVLINLIGNAIKFTESGHVELEINAKQLPDNNYNLLFSVTDTGIGIADDKTELVFESFSQANKDTTRKFGGTGLGLTITKKLVTLMGGSIQIASELGKGSKFYFTLNLKHGEADKDEQQQVKIIDTKTDQIYNILLVEDNRVNQVVVANYLKKWGLHVTYANHGKEALEKIVSKSYHLVLMDMQMPEMDGYEATKRIRAMEDPYFKNIPILAFTASVLTEKTAEIISIGFNDFITKPFNPKELNRKLFSYLKLR